MNFIQGDLSYPALASGDAPEVRMGMGYLLDLRGPEMGIPR